MSDPTRTHIIAIMARAMQDSRILLRWKDTPELSAIVLSALEKAGYVVVKKADHDYLCEAMWQLLDDMGEEGHCVCGAAKWQARVAYEPFKDPDPEAAPPMSFEEAKRLLDESERGYR